MARGGSAFRADGNIIIGTSVDMGGINTGLAKIKNSFKQLSYLTGASLGIVGLVKFGKAAINAASDLQEVQNIVDVAFGDMEYKVEAFAQTCVDKFGMSEFAAKQTAGSFMAMGNSIGLSAEDASNMAVQLTSLTGDMASFYNISQDYARVALSAVYTGETETLKRYGIILTEANLQEYATTQNITKKVKAMSAAEKVALRYNYVMQATNDMQGDFVRTSGNWANQIRVLQQLWNQFLIVLGNGLITVLTPLVKVLNQIIVALIQFAKTVGAILENIFGFTFQDFTEQTSAAAGAAEDLADAEDDVADATNKAGKAAKKALGPFDDLNALTSKQNSSSGTGAGGAVELSVPDITGGSIIGNLKDNLMSDIDNLYDLGKYISDTFRNILDSINWDIIFEVARNFGTGLAEFLNGLFQPETFSSVAATIANSLNTAIYAALSFGETFDWTNFGTALADGINTFFETFDFGALADTIDAWVQGIRDALVAFIQNVDWSTIWDGVKEFFTNLDIETVSIIIDTLIIAGIGKLVFGTLPAFIAKRLGEAIVTEFAAGGLAGLGEAFALAFGGAGTIGEALDAVFGPLTAVIGTIATVAAGIGGLILAVIEFFDMWETGWDLLSTIFEAIGIAIAAVAAILLGAPAAIAAAVAGIIFVISQIAIVIHDHWEEIKAWFAGIGEWINTTIVQPVLTFLQPIIDWIGGVIQTVKDVLHTIGLIGKALLIDFVNDIKVRFIKPITSLIQSIVSVVQSVWNKIRPILMIVARFFYMYVVLKIESFIDGLVSFIKSCINLAISYIENFINGIVDIINVFLGGLELIGTVAAKVAGEDDYSGITKLERLHIPRLAKGAVIPPNKEFMAILGDQKSGTNIEAPLDTIKQAVAEAFGEQMIALLAQQLAVLKDIEDKDIVVSENNLFKTIRDKARTYEKSTGVNAFTF